MAIGEVMFLAACKRRRRRVAVASTNCKRRKLPAADVLQKEEVYDDGVLQKEAWGKRGGRGGGRKILT